MLMAGEPHKHIRLEVRVTNERINHQVWQLELEKMYVTQEEKALIQNNRKKLLQSGHQW